MANVIVGHPDADFSGYLRVAGRGLLFTQGFTELVDLTAAQQTVLTSTGFTVDGQPETPVPDPFPQYLTEGKAATAIGGTGPLGVAGRAAFGLAGVVRMDDFAGADDDAKLTAALTYAAAQTHRPAVMLPARQGTFNQGGRTPFNGMRLIGPVGADGPKNLEVGDSVANHKVILNVGNGASAWFVGTGVVYDVFVGGIAFQEGNANAQFWHQPLATAPGLFASQFHSLNFFGFKHIFGTPSSAAALTQVSFTGHWTVIGFRDTAFTITGSDNKLWTDAIANIGSVQTAPAAGTPQAIFDGLAKSAVGMVYLTTSPGWAGIKLRSGGDGVALYSPVIEGQSPTVPADQPLLVVEGGSWSLYTPNLNHVNPAAGVNGVITQSGGRLTLHGPRYKRASSASGSFPLLYQTGGTARINDPLCLTSAEDIKWRRADGTTIDVYPDDQEPGYTSAVGTSTHTLVDTSFVSVTGLTASVNAPGTGAQYRVTVTLDVKSETASNPETMSVYLSVDGPGQPGSRDIRLPALGERVPVQRTWIVTGLAAGSHTLTVAVTLTGAAGSYTVFGASSRIEVQRVA